LIILRNKKALTEATLLQGRLIIYVLPPYFMIFSQISTQKVRIKFDVIPWSYNGLTRKGLIIRPLTLKDHFQSFQYDLFSPPETLFTIFHFYLSYRRVNH